MNHITVPRQMIENEIAVFKAKVDLQRAMLNAHIQQSRTFRALVGGFLKQQGFANPGQPGAGALNEWTRAHQVASKAQEDLLRVTLKEFESQIQIREAALADSEKKVHIPGGPVI